MLLKKLSEAQGVSGNEKEVRNILREELAGHAEEIKTDVLGNLIACKGKKRKPRVMITAHMDEVGMMVIGFEKNGLVRMSAIGAVDERFLVSKPVLVGPDRVPGVIGAKAIHLQKPEERKKSLTMEDLFLDLGAGSKEEAEKLVKQGDYISFATKAREMGDDYFLGKALDNRAGCALVLEAFKGSYDLELVSAFTVQEEIGLRGATSAAYSIRPDFALVIETTSAIDLPGVEKSLYATTVGGGPAITFMDSSYIAPLEMVQLIEETAKMLDIPYQYRQSTAAATDAGKIAISREGIPTGVISIPCRYIHTPASILSLADWKHTVQLLTGVLSNIAEGGLDRAGIA